MCIRLAVVKPVDCSIAPQIVFSCRPRRRRKGRGSREAGETVGLPRGASPARSEATQREGAARPLRIGVNKRVARLPRLRGLVLMK
jgi:hypothetical protein